MLGERLERGEEHAVQDTGSDPTRITSTQLLRCGWFSAAKQSKRNILEEGVASVKSAYSLITEFARFSAKKRALGILIAFKVSSVDPDGLKKLRGTGFDGLIRKGTSSRMSTIGGMPVDKHEGNILPEEFVETVRMMILRDREKVTDVTDTALHDLFDDLAEDGSETLPLIIFTAATIDHSKIFTQTSAMEVFDFFAHDEDGDGVITFGSVWEKISSTTLAETHAEKIFKAIANGGEKIRRDDFRDAVAGNATPHMRRASFRKVEPAAAAAAAAASMLSGDGGISGGDIELADTEKDAAGLSDAALEDITKKTAAEHGAMNLNSKEKADTLLKMIESER